MHVKVAICDRICVFNTYYIGFLNSESVKLVEIYRRMKAHYDDSCNDSFKRSNGLQVLTRQEGDKSCDARVTTIALKVQVESVHCTLSGLG